MQLVDAETADQEAIRSLAPKEAVVTFKSASVTKKSLDDAYARANDLMPTWIKGGIPVYQVAIDTIGNTLQIGLSRLDPGWMNAIRGSLGHEAVSFVVSDQGEPASCSLYICLASQNPQLRAALRIWNSSVTEICSAGFIVHARQNPANSLMLTAGHCFSDNASIFHGDWNTSANDYLGPIVDSVFWSGSNTDAEMYDIANSRESNLMYLAVDITQIGSHAVGSPICMKGQGTGTYSCGQILNANVSQQYPDGTIVIQQVKTSFNVKGGDSGGPVYHGTNPTYYAHGLVTYRLGENVSLYSRIDKIQTNLNVDVCLNSSCN